LCWWCWFWCWWYFGGDEDDDADVNDYDDDEDDDVGDVGDDDVVVVFEYVDSWLCCLDYLNCIAICVSPYSFE